MSALGQRHPASSSSEPGPIAPNPRPSTRGACDRCRGQKLRCLRDEESQDDPQAPCVRCFKAGATCCYGIARRAGRPSASQITQAQAPFSQQQRRGTRGGKSTADGMPSNETTLITSSQDQFNLFNQEAHRKRNSPMINSQSSGGLSHEKSDCAVDLGSDAETESRSRASINDLSHALHCTTSDLLRSYFNGNLTWPDEELSLLGSQDSGKTHGLEQFGPLSSWNFNPDQAQAMDVHMQPSFPLPAFENAKNTDVNNYLTSPQDLQDTMPVSKAFQEAMDVDSLGRAAQIDPFGSRKVVEDASLPEQDQERSKSRKQSIRSPNSETITITEAQHKRMRELSELAVDLYAQLAAHNPNRCGQPVPNSQAFQDRLVGSVLRSSNIFLALLKSFYPSVARPTSSSSSPFHRFPNPPCTASSSTNQNNSPCSSSYSGTDGASPSASVLYELDDSIMDNDPGYSAPNNHAGSSAFSEPPQPTDVTTVLQLLTCYLRIVQLHSIMHNRFHDYLFAYTTLPTSQSPSTSSLNRQPHHLPVAVPPVFSGLQIGGVSLDPWGTFQVRFLLQISMHVLGEIELALGLPEEYVLIGRTASGRSDSRGGGVGLLEASVSSGFVKRVMKEGEWRGQRVEVVREQLRDLRSVLSGAVGGE